MLLPLKTLKSDWSPRKKLVNGSELNWQYVSSTTRGLSIRRMKAKDVVDDVVKLMGSWELPSLLCLVSLADFLSFWCIIWCYPGSYGDRRQHKTYCDPEGITDFSKAEHCWKHLGYCLYNSVNQKNIWYRSSLFRCFKTEMLRIVLFRLFC